MAEDINVVNTAGGGDYTSISSWESGEDGDITASGTNVTAVAECKGTVDNSISGTPTYFGGWTTDDTHRVIMRYHADQPPDGTMNTSRYYIRLDADGNELSIQIVHLEIIGLQFRHEYTSLPQRCVTLYMSSGSPAYLWILDRCVFWADSSDNNTHQFNLATCRADGNVAAVTNNMFMRDGDGFWDLSTASGYTVTTYCINNTFTMSDIGALASSNFATYHTQNYRNNLANSNRPFLVQYNYWTDDDDYNDYNFTSGTEEPYVLGSHGSNGNTFTFVNEDTDDKITSGDTGAKGKGQNLTDNPTGLLPQWVIDLVLTDMVGNDRGNIGNWDAGAYMVSTAQWKAKNYHLML